MNQDISTIVSIKSLIVFLLVLSRISGMIATAPLFSTFPIPAQLKAGFCALVAFIMYPFIVAHSNFNIPQDLLTMAIYVFKELAIGILIGFCASLIFVGVQIGGQLISMQMGLTIADTIDPVTRQSTPVIGQIYLYTASVIFIYINGYHWLFESLYGSYGNIPIGMDFGFSSQFVEKILFFTGQIFNIAFKLIMPIFGLLFTIDVALAFISKMMPQMNVFMVSIPLKIYIGITLMVIFLTTSGAFLAATITNFLDYIKSMFV